MYLFTPQINIWLDRPYDRLPLTGPHATAQARVEAALQAVPVSTLSAYELPKNEDDATRIIVNNQGERLRVYVHPKTLEILKTIPEEDRFTRMVFHFHGELLMGNIGSVFVELAASWAIIMIVTGLYLWWPRGRGGFGGIVYPRLNRGSRGFWRDLHAVTGFWISLFVLFLLVTGLPWAKVWGEYFKEIRRLTGTAVVEQDWTVGGTSGNMPQDSSGEHLAHIGQTILPPSAGIIRWTILRSISYCPLSVPFISHIQFSLSLLLLPKGIGLPSQILRTVPNESKSCWIPGPGPF